MADKEKPSNLKIPVIAQDGDKTLVDLNKLPGGFYKELLRNSKEEGDFLGLDLLKDGSHYGLEECDGSTYLILIKGTDLKTKIKLNLTDLVSRLEMTESLGKAAEMALEDSIKSLKEHFESSVSSYEEGLVFFNRFRLARASKRPLFDA